MLTKKISNLLITLTFIVTALSTTQVMAMHSGVKDINMYNNNDLNIFEACEYGNLERVESLCNKNPNLLNEQDDFGNTPLYYAYEYCEWEIAKLLIKNGAKEPISTWINTKELSSLSLACRYGAPEDIVKMLINEETVNATDKRNQTPLYYACYHGKWNLVKFLIDNGAEPSIPICSNIDECSPLSLACKYNAPLDIVEMLIKPEIINTPDEDNKTPLFYAIRNDNIKIVKLLISKGATITIKHLRIAGEKPDKEMLNLIQQEKKTQKRKTKQEREEEREEKKRREREAKEKLKRQAKEAKTEQEQQNIFEACKYGNLERVERLCDENPDLLMEEDDFHNTPLHYAFDYGNLNIVEYILSKNTNRALFQIQNHKGKTPLHYACYHEKWDLAKRLINNGAEPSILIYDHFGHSPLSEACMNNAPEDIVTMLIAPEIINTPDKNCETPLHHACNSKRWDLVKLLINNGAEPSSLICNNYESSPLSLACEYNAPLDIVEMLIKPEIINTPDDYGNTPLSFAINNNNVEIAKLLILRGAKITDEQSVQLEKIKDELKEKREQERKEKLKEIQKQKRKENQEQQNTKFIKLCKENKCSSKNLLDSFKKALTGIQPIVLSAKDVSGKTALYYACSNELWDIAKLIIEKIEDNSIAFDDEIFNLINKHLEKLEEKTKTQGNKSKKKNDQTTKLEDNITNELNNKLKKLKKSYLTKCKLDDIDKKISNGTLKIDKKSESNDISEFLETLSNNDPSYTKQFFKKIIVDSVSKLKETGTTIYETNLLKILNNKNIDLKKIFCMNEAINNLELLEKINEEENILDSSFYTELTELKNDNYCTICQDGNNAIEEKVTLPCEHIFCKACIDGLIKSANKKLECPNCRNEFKPADPVIVNKKKKKKDAEPEQKIESTEIDPKTVNDLGASKEFLSSIGSNDLGELKKFLSSIESIDLTTDPFDYYLDKAINSGQNEIIELLLNKHIESPTEENLNIEKEGEIVSQLSEKNGKKDNNTSGKKIKQQKTLKKTAKPNQQSNNILKSNNNILIIRGHKGSTAKHIPENEKEKQALRTIKKDQNLILNGEELKLDMTDRRWKKECGWVKKEQIINGINIHYVFNKKIYEKMNIILCDDFKIKEKKQSNGGDNAN